MYEKFLRDRITELRLKKNVSEYQMSLDLGQNRCYIQGISSGKSLPSMRLFFRICSYFDLTPDEFFLPTPNPSVLAQKAATAMEELSDTDILALLGIIRQLREKYPEHN